MFIYSMFWRREFTSVYIKCLQICIETATKIYYYKLQNVVRKEVGRGVWSRILENKNKKTKQNKTKKTPKKSKSRFTENKNLAFLCDFHESRWIRGPTPLLLILKFSVLYFRWNTVFPGSKCVNVTITNVTLN